MYRLTQEGKKYLKEGLPEKNLVKILEKGPIDLKVACKKIKNFEIALLWAKKNGWIKIEKGKIWLIKKPKFFEDEISLKKVFEGKKLSEKEIERLLKRKLIERIRPEVKKLAKEIIKKEITQLTPELIKSGLWKKVKLKKYDVKIPSKKILGGKPHPYYQLINEIREKLIGLGFVEARGPYVELNFWNCDALFMPSDHPARSIHDMLEVKYPRYGKIFKKEIWKRVKKVQENGWGFWDFELARKLVLRSQTTSVSARILAHLKEKNLPYKMFIIDRTFRHDVIDAKHFIEFDQCEGIVVAKDLNFRHLLGYLKEISKIVVGSAKIKFKPSYFPFTEPSVEGMVYHPKFGWLEIVGAGIFRPEVTFPLGIKYPVLAWGIGIARLAMIRLGIEDIRELYTKNIEWLRKRKVI